MEDMVKVSLPYRNGDVTIVVPLSRVSIIEPAECSVPQDSVQEVARAVEHPINSRSLKSLLAASHNPLVIVNDATRPTPTETVLDAVGSLLLEHKARFIVATGAHRPPTEAECARLFGKWAKALRARTLFHDARDISSLVDMGITKNGTPIILNKALFEADCLIPIGSVEPHYFAGFTGGRKAFLPGIAGYATIEANHKLALDARAKSLALADNPVSQDMTDALALITSPIFSIMTVLERHQKIAQCFAGDIVASFDAAVEKARAIFAVALPRKAGLVISIAREPMDIDLYQAQKAIDNGAMALSDGGVLILVGSCYDGAGDKAYLELLGSSATPQQVFEKIKDGYRLGYHKAAKMAFVSSRASIEAFCELDAATLARAFITKIDSVQKSVDRYLARAGSNAHIAILMDGSLTVPVPELT